MIALQDGCVCACVSRIQAFLGYIEGCKIFYFGA